MGHGLTSPLIVYCLPAGVKYLVIEIDDRGGAEMAAALGPSAAFLSIDDGSVHLFIDAAAEQEKEIK
jgi:hypothetical protein